MRALCRASDVYMPLPPPCRHLFTPRLYALLIRRHIAAAAASHACYIRALFFSLPCHFYDIRHSVILRDAAAAHYFTLMMSCFAVFFDYRLL